MTEKEFHRDTLIFAGVVIAALVLWAYFHDKIAAATGQYNPQVQPAQGPTFSLYGAPTVAGPLNFAGSTFNIPGLPPNGVYNPSSCNCGCSGGSPITFQFPDLTSFYTNLQEQNNANIVSSFYNFVGGLPYDEAVTVANNTPTAFGQ